MIQVPTSELLGLIGDVIGFAPAAKDSDDNGILIEWDGEGLHAAAYDVLSAGRATWLPGEGEEGEQDNDDENVTTWGGTDAPWRVFISAEDAREIVKTFKLPAKFRLVPLLVKHVGGYGSGASLMIERTKESGRTQHVAIFASDYDRAVKFPDVKAIALDAREHSAENSAETFSSSRLGTFGAVRPHGTMVITLGAEGYPSAVHIGLLFIGFIYSARPDAVAASRNRHNASRLTDFSSLTIETQLEQLYGDGGTD